MIARFMLAAAFVALATCSAASAQCTISLVTIVETRTICKYSTASRTATLTRRSETPSTPKLVTATAAPAPAPPSPGSAYPVGSLPRTPVNLVVTADDRYATISYDTNPAVYWNPGMGAPCQAWDWQTRLNAYSHSGYVVTWGPVGGTMSKAYTPYQFHQLQPLTSGVQYAASVQAVLSDGSLTTSSASVTFQSNSTRVDALRTSMAGFFDDFNTPAGALDETKWNTAISQCAYPQYSAAFINGQFHAHQVLASPVYCEKGLVVMRPRASFDFTGRTGTVVFDFDGSFHQTNWYLDLMQGDRIDMEGQIHIADTQNPGAPANMLRIRSNMGTDQTLAVLFFGSDGIMKVLKSVQLDALGVPLIRNVRRPFIVKISQSSLSITVSGKLVLQTTLALPYSKGTLHFTAYSYDTTAADEPFATIHWDNFGFDGPGSDVVTRNYPTVNPRLYYDQYSSTSWGTKGAWQSHFPVSQYTGSLNFQVYIPDNLAGITAARLMFTVHAEYNSPTIVTAVDIVKLNGVSIGAIPPPTEGSLATAAISSFEAGRAFSISLNPTQLIQLLTLNKNLTVTFVVPSGSPTRIRVGNLHIEVDYPAGTNPPYTPPTPWFGTLTAAGSYHPIMQTLQEKIGPAYWVTGLAPHYSYKYVDQALAFGKSSAGVSILYNATVTMGLVIHNEIEITGYGTGSAVGTVNLLCNNASIPGVSQVNLPGTQSVLKAFFTFNTASLGPKGVTYQLMPVITNSKGAPALPNFVIALDGKLGSRTGDYLPFRIKTV